MLDEYLAEARSGRWYATTLNEQDVAQRLWNLPGSQHPDLAADLARYIAEATPRLPHDIPAEATFQAEFRSVAIVLSFLAALLAKETTGRSDVLDEICRLRIGDGSLHPLQAHEECREHILRAIERHAATGADISAGMRTWLEVASDVWRSQPRSPIRGLQGIEKLLGELPPPRVAAWNGESIPPDAVALLDSLASVATVRDTEILLRQKASAVVDKLLELPRGLKPALLVEVARRIDHALPEFRAGAQLDASNLLCFTLARLLGGLIEQHLKNRPDLIDWVCRWSLRPRPICPLLETSCDHLYPVIKEHGKAAPLTPDMRAWVENYAARPCWMRPEHAAERNEFAVVLGRSKPTPLTAGEAWSDTAITDIAALPDTRTRDSWIALLDACHTATAAAPTGKWLKSVKGDIDLLGERTIAAALCRWFPLVEKPRTGTLRVRGYAPERFEAGSHHLLDHHMTILRGLCWIAASLPAADYTPDLARALGRLAISSYKKVPGVGPRAVRIGNAAIQALGQIPGPDALGQLAMLKVKVKFIPAQKGIDKALSAAAAREGLPREEIEELAVPAYGLTGVGILEEALGGYTARMTVEPGGDTTLVFLQHTTDKKGAPVTKTIKSAPAAVKKDHAEALKEFKAAMKDIAAMVPAQKERIDSLFLEQKSWAYSTWRERYLDHPIVGVIARRLIWTIVDRADEPGRAVTWLESESGGEGALVDANGRPQSFNEAAAIVRLWHPLDSDTESTLAWRRFFEDRELRQPFKQAHREVYILTEAERNTRVYSNRFAAHIIRQHQFHALAAARGWKNKLRLLVDAEYPPATKQLEKWGLRAEFWIEGAGDEWGTDTNEAGAYLRLVTDQVRFYAIAAAQVTAHAGGGGYGVTFVRRDNDQPGPAINEPIALDQIPPLVLSEILRDVDLFVGVSSIGNNPEWTDGGPEARYREYWHHYSFGELSNTAQTRRELLGRLIPRLKIAPVCTLSEKYLRVQGTIRAYHIHLGSGNILMEPNDQYLCIVPSSRDDSVSGIHLPFEGDRVLSIILSKAFMLAADDQIKDSSITGQIRRK